MKRFIKITGVLFILIVVSVSGLAAYVKLALPSIEAPELTVEITPEKVARGKYLATNVMVCMDCHSQRDFSKFSGPPIAETWGGGGEKFGHEIGMPGEVYASNITPSKLSEYTDGELYRAITSGVAKDGRAMFNIMPYGAYGRADKKDIEAVIAYIRSIQPVENDVPLRSLDFPVSILINTVPVVANHEVTPDKSNTVEYGRYMVMISGCVECHTPMSSPGKLDMDFAFSGGFEFAFPDGSVVRSMNITPHATGLGAWTKEMFINKFKGYNLETYTPSDVASGDFNTVMPWTMYAGMSEEDLSAIYEYLRTVTPMNKTVERFTGPSEKQM